MSFQARILKPFKLANKCQKTFNTKFLTTNVPRQSKNLRRIDTLLEFWIRWPCEGRLNQPQFIDLVCWEIFSYILPAAMYIYVYIYERRLSFKLIWKAAFVWVTPYLVQLTFSLEACSWKNGDLVFQRWSFFSILETCMGIDDPYVKKPRWRRNWNAISKMIKDGLAEGMVIRKLCVEVLDLVLTSFQTSSFSGHHE